MISGIALTVGEALGFALGMSLLLASASLLYITTEKQAFRNPTTMVGFSVILSFFGFFCLALLYFS